MESNTITRRRSWAALALLVAVVALGGVLIGALVTDDHDTAYASQVASIQQGCQQWFASDTSATIDCARMGAWMSGRMAAGGMAPSMMFGNPDQMTATCRQWMSQVAAATTASPQAQCDAMVGWMNGHMGDWAHRGQWDDWMTNGPMMDG